MFFEGFQEFSRCVSKKLVFFFFCMFSEVFDVFLGVFDDL